MMNVIITILLTWMTVVKATIPDDMQIMMDPTVNPCQDFYKYACGKWIKNYKLKPSDKHKNIVGSIHELSEQNAKLLKEIIKGNHPIVGELWDSCINMKTITKLGNKPLQTDLKRISDSKTKEDVFKLLGEFSRTGTNAFLSVQVDADPKDATINTLVVGTPDFTLPDDSLYSDEYSEFLQETYGKYIKKMIKLSGFKIPKAIRSRSIADKVINMEKELLKFKSTPGKFPTHMTITDTTKRFPITFGSFTSGFGLRSKIIIKDDFKIFISVTYVDLLEKWVHSTSIDDLKLYVAYSMVHSRVQWLGNDFYTVWFKFFGKILNGDQEPSHRRDVCTQYIQQYIPDVIGTHFYTKAFDAERQQHVSDIMTLLKKSMEQHLMTTNWMESTDVPPSLEKLKEMLPLIGKPKVPKSYPNGLSRDNFPANVFLILSHSFDNKLQKLGHRVNREEWEDSATTENAFYHSSENKIVVPAGLLQPPLYNGPRAHPARNFGAIGSMIGHEITHGFDNEGRKYDKHGNKRNWWDVLTSNKFQNSMICFEDQYSNFIVDGEHHGIGRVRGRNTLDENIADNGGLALAWASYRKYITDHPEIRSDDKLFYLAYGQSLCSKAHDQTMIEEIESSSHAPSQWRVNGAIMNHMHFATVYQCDQNSPMNPSHKCQIW